MTNDSIVLLSHNFAAILYKIYFRFRLLQLNEQAMACRIGNMLLTFQFPHLPVNSLKSVQGHPKRESDTRFSISGFFHESVSPRPISIPMGPF
jgi:hypothetical protein